MHICRYLLYSSYDGTARRLRAHSRMPADAGGAHHIRRTLATQLQLQTQETTDGRNTSGRDTQAVCLVIQRWNAEKENKTMELRLPLSYDVRRQHSETRLAPQHQLTASTVRFFKFRADGIRLLLGMPLSFNLLNV